MKTPIFTISLILALPWLCDQASAATRQHISSHSATFLPRHRAVQTREPAVALRPEVAGVIPRAVRGENPLQMLNPKAPAKYGNWVQSTSFDPNVPGKWRGIKLFEVLF